MREGLLYAPFLLVPFTVQLAVLFATRNRFQPLRFAVPVLVGAGVVLIPLLSCFAAPPGWGILLLPITVIICLLLASLALTGWLLAGFAYYLISRTNPA